jgi:hypothetical protein
MGEDDEEENDKIDELLSLAEDYKEQQQPNGAGHETGRASVSARNFSPSQSIRL